MQDSQDSPPPADWQKTVNDLGERAQNMIREEPSKAIGAAVLGGLLLTILPIGGLVGVLLRLIMTLARPLLLVLGAVKLYQEFDKKQKSNSDQ